MPRNSWKRLLTFGSKAVILGAFVLVLFVSAGQVFDTPIARAAPWDDCFIAKVNANSSEAQRRAAALECDQQFGSNPSYSNIELQGLQSSGAVENITPTEQQRLTEYQEAAANTPESDSCNSFACWIAQLIYIFTVGLGTAVAYIGAWVFSNAVAISLSSTAYALTFLSEGWRIVRDIANMFFILILVYIALTVMFRADTAETMKRLAWVIIIALVINFSFFFVRVVIDAGNLLAVQFYNVIQAPPVGTTVTNSGVSGDLLEITTGSRGLTENTKDLTASIMNGVGVQSIVGNESFERFRTELTQNKNFFSAFITELIALVVIYIALGAILFILAAMFFTVAIKFIVRTAVLWLVLIAAPLALIAKTLKQSELYYQKWQDALIMHAFYPAVFLFIFYILTLFMAELAPCASQGGVNCNDSVVAQTFFDASNIPAETGFFSYIAALLAGIAIRLGFVIALVYIGLKASEQMGVMGSQLANKIAGKVPLMGGLKSYGRLGGLAYQQSIGRGAAGLDKRLATGRFAGRLGNMPLVGRVLRGATGGVAGAKFGGAGSFTEYRSDADKRAKERSANLWTINNKEDINKLGDLEEKQGKGTPLTAAEQAEHKRISDRVSRFGKSDIESLKSGDLERIVRVLKEGQIKNIKESDKFNASNIAKIEQAWHEQGGESPLQKSIKSLVDISKKSNIVLTKMSHAKQHGVTIDDTWVADLKRDLETAFHDANATFRINPTPANSATLRNADQALRKIDDDFDKQRKEIPANATINNNAGKTFNGSLLP